MENFITMLKEAGAKLTFPRKLIIENLLNITKPLTLKEIHNLCNQINFTSVYRSIKLFEEVGIVEEIIFADKKVRYKIVSNINHHHHIICSECGAINEIPICLLSEIKKITNYKITKHTLEFMGLCPECQ